MSVEFILSIADGLWWHAALCFGLIEASFFFFFLLTLYTEFCLTRLSTFSPLSHHLFFVCLSIIYSYLWILYECIYCCVCECVSGLWAPYGVEVLDPTAVACWYSMADYYGCVWPRLHLCTHTHTYTHSVCSQGCCQQTGSASTRAHHWGQGVGGREKEIKWDINK